MATPSSSSAQAARQALANRLRELRLEAGLTGRALSREAGWHEAKTSRIEYARKVPSEDDLRRWARACGREELIPELLAQLRAVELTWLDWQRAERSGLTHLNVQVRDIYERTRRFRFYSPSFVPGPVQTAEYVTAILTSVRNRRDIQVDDVAQAVAERMARQHIVHEGEHSFRIILEEAALHTPIGGAQVQAGQLQHLLAVMRLPSMSLGIIPADADRSGRQWPLEMFFMFDDTEVQVELTSGFLRITAPSEIAMYASAFADLNGMAVVGDSARSLIERALARLAE